MFEKVTIRTVDKNGWPIDFELIPEPGQLAKSIAFLEAHGYRPAPMGEDKKGFEYTPEGLPICPRHGEPMRKREKQGDTWYSHTVDDGRGHDLYCRGYKSKNSPGWEVES
jgi:hypothetical protein